MYSTNQPNSAAPQHYGQQGLALGVPVTSQKHQYPPQGYMQPAEKGPWSTLDRTLLRNEYMLEEKPCNDCCLHFCCECCAL
ncbi:hypothetical protein Gotur_013547 [Gossypium turneri]